MMKTKKVLMIWLGGPQDGGLMAVDERYVHTAIRVISGGKDHPEQRYVTPRLTEAGRWILPFYEGKTTEETR